jgi:hypothetical protein
VKNNQLLKIERLDQALLMWEEMMWACNIKQQACKAKSARVGRDVPESAFWPPLVGPIMHYKELRQHLLAMETLDDFDCGRFQMFPQEKDEWIRNVPTQGVFAGQLAAWTMTSRRAYHIDNDLKALLGATSLEGLRAEDIHFPFESFGISLDEPIEGENGSTFDFILYSPLIIKEDGKIQKFPAIRLLGTNLAKERSIPREAINKKIARGKIEEANELLSRKASYRKQDYLDTLAVLAGFPQDRLVLDLIKEFDQPQTIQGWRIVFGLMLYLKMLADARTHVSDWQGVERRSRPLLSPDKRAITDEAQVCYVSSVRKLGAEERQALNHFASGKVSGHEMPYHFREGHWRRPPGKGNDPTWPKTVLVQPTVVRKDRKPDDAIAGGSLVLVK